MNIAEMVAAVQKELGVGIDGKAGPETWHAIYKRICGNKSTGSGQRGGSSPPGVSQQVDARSETVIATLQPEVRPYARALVHKAAGAGITIKVISGLRTYDEQNALYAQGRSESSRMRGVVTRIITSASPLTWEFSTGQDTFLNRHVTKQWVRLG